MRLMRVVYILIKQFHEILVRFNLDVLLQNDGLQVAWGPTLTGYLFFIGYFIVHRVRDLLVNVDQIVGTRGQHLVAASVSYGDIQRNMWRQRSYATDIQGIRPAGDEYRCLWGHDHCYRTPLDREATTHWRRFICPGPL